MPYVIISSAHPLGSAVYTTAEDAAASVQAALLRGDTLPPGTRIAEVAPDSGIDVRRGAKADADLLGSAASGIRACEQLAREGRVATARECANAFRAVLAAAGLADQNEVRGAALVVMEEIRAAKRPPPEPEPDPRELEPAEPVEGVRG